MQLKKKEKMDRLMPVFGIFPHKVWGNSNVMRCLCLIKLVSNKKKSNSSGIKEVIFPKET